MFFYVIIFLIQWFFVGYICSLPDLFLFLNLCANSLIIFDLPKKLIQFMAVL
jgi:hypothetical protein